jgi:hypothetical protein
MIVFYLTPGTTTKAGVILQDQLSWEKSSPKDVLKIAQEQAWKCWKVEASGEELEMLGHCSKNIPVILDQDHMVWFGDLAKFIAGNVLNVYRNLE